jgi:hypothetical protein
VPHIVPDVLLIESLWMILLDPNDLTK